jgi:outer membrane protein OmpA-like peptidoglycan-associated protein
MNTSSIRQQEWESVIPSLFFILLFIGLQVPVLGQTSAQVDRANKFFELAENYEAALPLYKEAVSNGEQDPQVMYRLGFCYMQAFTLDEKLKSIPYLEKAAGSNDKRVPNRVYYLLGRAYHLNINIDKAIDAYVTYRKTLSSEKEKEDVDRQLEICGNAQFFLSQDKGIVINSFGTKVNSRQTEYNPIVTADESYLFYTALEKERDEFVEKIMYSERFDGTWSEPNPVKLKTDRQVGTAGLSPDGREMLIFVGEGNNTGNIYITRKDGKKWTLPVTMGNQINSRYLETTASITPNGNTIYFASNRPGGQGGMDIYRAEKQENGEWSQPVNLGPEVNTPYDEDAPFIHPDGKTLFFSSDGHNTMGGRDIFRTVLVKGNWREPVNMGYPINTPSDDNYFSLTANGEKAYFSSERKGGKGGQDIYYFNMPEQDANIPLTMIKGRILVGEDKESMKPVPTTIKVLDKTNNEKLDYVYNPSKDKGNYLIILPPGRNYDLIIESDGYLPYTVNVNIPNQTYFYELYQEILLKPIKQFDEVVGQEVFVNNAFYDTEQKAEEVVRQANEAMLVRNDSLDLYDMMEAIISSTDTAAYEYLLDLMYTTNPIDSIDFESLESDKVEAAGVAYYYDETGPDDLIAQNIGDETIYTLPTFFVTKEAVKQKEQEIEVTHYDKSLLDKTYTVYFGAGLSKVTDKEKDKLAPVLETLKQHEVLGVEIAGYASPEGDEERNRELSKERAIKVLQFLNTRGIVRRRILAKGYGAIASNARLDEGRKVEIRLIDILKESGEAPVR